MRPEYIVLSYLLLISAISCAVCIYDKWAARRGKRRIRESTLMWLCVLGGSVVMFTVMKIIHHKTRHVKFMVGIPLIIMAQVALAYVLIYLI